MSGRSPAEETRAVPRETRRPVDVFFPDRRGGEDVDLLGADGGARRTRQRATMPPLQARGKASQAGSRTPTPGTDLGAQSTQVVSESQVEHSEGRASTDGASDAATDRRLTPQRGKSMGSAGDAELRLIPVAEIHPNPRQPRDVFDEGDMDELVASIRQVGVLQPIVVREVEGPSPFELVMGERRWRAAQAAGLDEIPAIVRHTADTDLLRDALLENLHRSQLNPLEEAAAYEQLLEDFNCTQEELSSRIGRSRPQITNTLRLLKLPPLVQRRVASSVLSAGHARALLSLVDPAEMERLAQKVVSEGLSVRATEELVSLQDGVRQVKPQSRAKRADRHERLDYLANSLTDRLDTSVKITLGARKGKIAIDFASVDDLNRIMDLIGQSESNDS
ncbi:ParB/RepB/Spo0J family partition protein [Microbacterium sp. A93]|uniref:ParB/RepB/Spo0J family partition protein n=1 Tax=Microbacterium sp. A93 TaxID=3450716 RepID=UPI003F426567